MSRRNFILIAISFLVISLRVGFLKNKFFIVEKISLQKIKILYQDNKRGIFYYLLLKTVIFGLFLAGVYLLKNRLIVDSSVVYDFEILQFINPDDIFVLLLFAIFWIITFILERNFLIFYFVNKYKKRRITKELFWRDFFSKQFVQLKLFLLEVVANIFYLFVFGLIIYGWYYIFGLGRIFYLGGAILLALFIVFVLYKFSRFILVMYLFFDNPYQKNVFVYFAKEIDNSKSWKVLKILFLGILLFGLAFFIGFVVTLVFQYVVSFIPSFSWQVFILVAELFFQAILFFAINIAIYLYIFLRTTEIFFGKKFIVSRLEQGGELFADRWILLQRCLIGVVFIGLVVAYGYVTYLTLGILNDENKPKIIFAHRGFSEYNVQNTLPSFRKAVGNADFIELDIQITKDGKLIVFHDENFEKLTGQIGVATQRNFDEIKKYTIKEKKQLPGQAETIQKGKIVLLEDVFGEFAGKIKFAVEIKDTDKSREQEVVDKLNNLIEKYNIINDVVIISLDYDVLQTFKKVNPKIKRGLILTYPVSDLGQFDVDFYFINSLINSERLIKRAHKLGRPIYFWNFSFWQDDFEKEYVLGADGFIVDNPIKTKQEIDWYRKMPLAEKVNIIFKDLLK